MKSVISGWDAKPAGEGERESTPQNMWGLRAEIPSAADPKAKSESTVTTPDYHVLPLNYLISENKLLWRLAQSFWTVGSWIKYMLLTCQDLRSTNLPSHPEGWNCLVDKGLEPGNVGRVRKLSNVAANFVHRKNPKV